MLKKWKKKSLIFLKKLFGLPTKLKAKEQARIIQDSVKVTFVRHPFLRLVSTYQDKIVDHKGRADWRAKCFTFPTHSAV